MDPHNGGYTMLHVKVKFPTEQGVAVYTEEPANGQTMLRSPQSIKKKSRPARGDLPS